MTTINDAQEYVRKFRDPGFDDADSDAEYARIWERRHGGIAAWFCWIATGNFALGIESWLDFNWALIPLAVALEQGGRWFRLRQARRVFEGRAGDSKQ